MPDFPDHVSREEYFAQRKKALMEAEKRLLQEQHAEREKCECKQGMFATLGRRGFMTSALVGGAGLLTAGAGRAAENDASPGAKFYEVQDEPWNALGSPIMRNDGYGTRSQFETAVRWRFDTPTMYSSWTMTPLEANMGIVTPSGLHFERHHAGIPTIHPQQHRLLIHGMVDNPLTLTMDQLRRYPSVSRFHFIECSGNSLTEWDSPGMKTAQAAHGLVSTSEWTGVPLSTLLQEVGVQEDAAWVLLEGADGATLTRSIPLEKCWSDVLLAYGQNGEAIRPEQGYPLRAVVPGYEGNTHIKWLRRIEVSDKPFMTRWETRTYTDLMPDGKALQFTFVMGAKSVITFPAGEMKLPGPGFYEISGLAWSGRGRVRSVEVSTDNGNTWYPASLEEPIMPICQTRFRFPWRWNGEETVIQSRCIDETGNVQPTHQDLVDIRGRNSFYHYNGIQRWQVAQDGSVTNALA